MFRVGVVGCGYWGSKHVRVFNELPIPTAVSICDADPKRLEAMRRGYPVAFATTEYDALLASDIDAAVIAVPAAHHAAFARRALLAGKHVLVEKPFTTRSVDAVELINLAEDLGLTIAVGHTFLYNPAVRALKELICSGRIGVPQYLHSARLNFGLLQPDVNVLWDLAPHDISIFLYLLGKLPTAVAARGSGVYNPRQFEVAHADLQFEGNIAAYLHVSWLDPSKVRRTIVVGSEKMVVYDDLASGEPLKIYDRSVAFPDNGAKERWPPRYSVGDILIPRVAETEPLKEECADFADSVLNGKKPVSDGRAGLQVVRVLEHLEMSLSNGGALVAFDLAVNQEVDEAKRLGLFTSPLASQRSASRQGV